jgi:hypothetical protein
LVREKIIGEAKITESREETKSRVPGTTNED